MRATGLRAHATPARTAPLGCSPSPAPGRAPPPPGWRGVEGRSRSPRVRGDGGRPSPASRWCRAISDASASESSSARASSACRRPRSPGLKSATTVSPTRSCAAAQPCSPRRRSPAGPAGTARPAQHAAPARRPRRWCAPPPPGPAGDQGQHIGLVAVPRPAAHRAALAGLAESSDERGGSGPRARQPRDRPSHSARPAPGAPRSPRTGCVGAGRSASASTGSRTSALSPPGSTAPAAGRDRPSGAKLRQRPGETHRIGTQALPASRGCGPTRN